MARAQLVRHTEGIVRSECLELVGRRHEWQAGERRNLACHCLGEALKGVETRTDGRAADGERVHVG